MSMSKGDAALEDMTEDAKAELVGPGGLTQRQERALQAVIAYPIKREAAQAAGVSDATLWRYMRNKDFKRRLGEASEASIAYANVQRQGAAGEAVKMLRDLMCKDDAPHAS